MKSSRLLTLLCCLTLSALTSAKNVSDTLWCVASTDNDLAALLKQSGYVLQRAADNHSLLSQAPKGASVLLLGDGSRSMQQLRELFAGNGMIGYVMKERVDGVLVLPEAVRVLKIAS